MRVFRCVWLLVLAIVALTGLPVLEAASAQDVDFWKQAQERQDTVSRFVYRQSPQAVPSGYSPVAEAEEYLRQAQRSLSASNPQAQSVWQQARGLTSKTGLSVAPRVLGSISLAVGTFELGWKVGTGINAKFLRLGVPEQTTDINAAVWDTVRWRSANSGSYFGATYPAQAGWVPEFFYGSFRYDRWFSSICTSFTGFTPPAPFSVFGPVSSSALCTSFPRPIPAEVMYGWAPENAFGAPGPIEDYTSQSYSRYTPEPTPPAQSTVEQSIEDELDAPENAVLRQWLNYTLGSPGEDDPLGVGEPNPEIEFPGFVEHWTEHGDEFDTPYEDPVEYWRDAADIVERGEITDPDVLVCERQRDRALIYWDTDRQALVIVKDGKIVTYFRPDDGFDYWLDECSG
jgi:hypothetical protein